MSAALRKRAGQSRKVRTPSALTTRGVRLWGFLFRATLHRLERLCARFLNQDPSGRIAYQPYAPFVLLTFSATDLPIGRRLPPPRLNRGVECELSIWVPVRRRGSVAPMMFAPYVFTNDPLAAIEGRELYGLPKEIAFLKPQRWPRQFAIDALIVDKFDPEAVASWGRVLTVERVRRSAKSTPEWNSYAVAAADLQRRLLDRAGAGVPAAAEMLVLGEFWPPNGRVVQLKQFPDCADGRFACYSGLVEADSRVTQLLTGAILGDVYALHLPLRASHPLAEDLGLQHGDRPLFVYEMQCRVEMHPGQEVWRAPQPAPAMPAPALIGWLSQITTAVPRRIVDLGATAVRSVTEAIAPGTSTPAAPTAVPRSAQRQSRAWRPRGREKVAILGGGVGAMAAAFALTEGKDWQRHYDVTVYQLGWRLGGKGASGRDMSAPHRRIEEHGLHGWFGFYENAFRMMRQCFRELPELRDWPHDVDPLLWGFEPHDDTLIEELVGGGWRHHPVSFPRNDERPGTAITLPLDPGDYIHMILERMAAHLSGPMLAEALDEGDAGLAALAPFVSDLAALASAAGAQWLTILGRAAELLLAPLDRVLDRLWTRLEPRVARNDAARRLYIALDFGAAVVRGLIRDDVVTRGFDAVEENATDWLRRHGATPITLESDWVRVLYAMTFAFLGGDVSKPRTAAGPAIRAVLRMLLTYRGAFLWKMRSGMGDTIFAPLYRALRARGVKFKFFHRVRALHLSDDQSAVERVSIGQQATPRNRDYPYLVDIKGRWCWPNAPDYTALEEEAEIRALQATPGAQVNFESAWSSWGPEYEDPVELRRGFEFDRVVLGISLGALPGICGELIAADERWRNMVKKVPTIRTQAFQLWLKPTLAQAGYAGPSPLMTAYVRPFETWGDMTHTSPTEAWPQNGGPQQIAYLCGPMRDAAEPEPYTDPAFPQRMRARVFAAMSEFVTANGAHLWPSICDANGLDCEHLVDPADRRGAARLQAQFWIGNIDPSERYVLSVPGSIRYRLRSDRSGFSNLYLAGDWTFNGLNLGCVEAAVMSGFRAAQAITGRPMRIVGEEHLGAPNGG